MCQALVLECISKQATKGNKENKKVNYNILGGCKHYEERREWSVFICILILLENIMLNITICQVLIGFLNISVNKTRLLTLRVSYSLVEKREPYKEKTSRYFWGKTEWSYI